ncbi:MAG: hypothetical protein NNA22_09450, partial [Nitrospira sp.]|nr:hypothetical protein [Nitrospira sp.]
PILLWLAGEDDRGWEEIVDVKATIDRNGNWVKAVVTKTPVTGRWMMTCWELVQKACLLPLTQNLSKPKITVTTPIHYRLDTFGS